MKLIMKVLPYYCAGALVGMTIFDGPMWQRIIGIIPTVILVIGNMLEARQSSEDDVVARLREYHKKQLADLLVKKYSRST